MRKDGGKEMSGKELEKSPEQRLADQMVQDLDEILKEISNLNESTIRARELLQDARITNTKLRENLRNLQHAITNVLKPLRPDEEPITFMARDERHTKYISTSYVISDLERAPQVTVNDDWMKEMHLHPSATRFYGVTISRGEKLDGCLVVPTDTPRLVQNFLYTLNRLAHENHDLAIVRLNRGNNV